MQQPTTGSSRHQKIVWCASVGIGKIQFGWAGGGGEKNVLVFRFNFLQQNAVRLFFAVLRQFHPQSFLVFILKQKDDLGASWLGENGTKMSQTDVVMRFCRCLK